jgi:hypothetical protein
MIWPVRLKTDSAIPCQETVHYLVASNGIFKVCQTETYRSVTRVREIIPGLLPERESLRLTCPRVPASLLRHVLAFFRAVYIEHGGEAIVVLFYRPNTRTYRLGIPRQTIPGYKGWDGSWRPYVRLRYEPPPRPSGYLRFGTIHSHASCSAEPSAVDCADEEFEDGLHAVYGHITQPQPSRSACFVSNGVRFPLIPDDALEPCAVPGSRADPAWVARVRREETGIVADQAFLWRFDAVPFHPHGNGKEGPDDGG